MKLVLSLFLVTLQPGALPQEVRDSSAFDHYDFAIEEAALQEADWILQAKLRSSPASISPTEEEEYRERWEPIVRAIEAGAACSQGIPRETSEFFEFGSSRPLFGMRSALNATVIEMRRALADGRLRHALELSAAGAEYAADLVDQPRLIDRHVAVGFCFMALPEAWRDEDLALLDSQSAAVLDSRLAEFENRLPREIEICAASIVDPQGHLRDPEYTAMVMNESLIALRIQLRFLRMANALHQGNEVPLLADEPSGTLEIEATAEGQFILRSKLQGSSRRSPYSRAVTLR